MVSGPGAQDEELIADVGAQLGIPVQSADPLGMLDSGVVESGDDAHRYTVAAGLAMGAHA